MRPTLSFATLLAGALLLSSSAVMAQQGKKQPRSEQKNQQDKQKTKGQMNKQGKVHELLGTAQKMEQARPRAAKTDNMIVLMETAQGKHIAVDLGPQNNLQNVKISKGTPLAVKGSIVSIKGKPYFMAKQLTVGERKLQVERRRPQQQRQMQTTRNFSGQISQIRDVKVKGAPERHKLVILKTQQGRQLYVDLGPTSNLRKLDLAKGDMLNVRGTGTRIDNRAVLIAEQLQAGNQTVQVQRKALPPREQLARAQRRR